MKKNNLSVLTAFIIFFSIFSSCKFGIHQAFYRKNQVNERSKEIKDFSSTSDDPQVNEGKFSVVIITDLHFGRLSFAKTDRFKTWYAAKKSEAASSAYPVKFAVCLGDISENGRKNQMQDYVSFCNEVFAGIKIYTVTGNHDLYNDGWDHFRKSVYPFCSSYKFETSFGGKSLSWYFLDTGNGTLGKPQLESLLKKIKADSNPKIVLTHYPVYAGGGQLFTMQNENERDLLLSTFLKNNVKALFGGHWHKYEEYSYKNYFTEYNFSSFVDYEEAAIVKVDLNSMNIDVQCSRF